MCRQRKPANLFHMWEKFCPLCYGVEGTWSERIHLVVMHFYSDAVKSFKMSARYYWGGM